MAELSPQFKKELLEGKHDLEDYGMTVKLEDSRNWLERTYAQFKENLFWSEKPVFNATHVAVYQDNEPKEKLYFDIETPLHKCQDGTWKRWTPLVAMFDLADKQAKEATDTLDIRMRNGIMEIK